MLQSLDLYFRKEDWDSFGTFYAWMLADETIKEASCILEGGYHETRTRMTKRELD